ncbi:MAG TPA: peptidylprolyl isomerase [Burkholderiales bacterium]|nr:peptidylprolyl isomerase [Burkholderiales bacterium]
MSGIPIGRDTVVSLAVEMYDAQGALLSAAREPTTYLHGGYGGLLPALEQALEGKPAGEELRVQLEPEQAFGEYDAELVRLEPVERYGEGLAVGMEIEEGKRMYTVTDIGGGKAVLDANHPLAGVALRFFLKVISVRAASAEEIRQGVSSP